MQTTIALNYGPEQLVDHKALASSSPVNAMRCDYCQLPVDQIAYLTQNDFLLCSRCAMSDTWQRGELWLVRHIGEL